METKPLLYGLIGFFIGGLLVSVAATTFDQPDVRMDDMSMNGMTRSLEGLKGNEYDAKFIEYMIEHHESAVDMAKLSESRANHKEIIELSREIIAAQTSEIDKMNGWKADWMLESEDSDESMMMH